MGIHICFHQLTIRILFRKFSSKIMGYDFYFSLFFKTIRTVFLTDFLCSWLYLFYLCTYEILMWLSFGIRPAKNEHKRLLILKIQSPLVTAFGLSFFLSPKVGNSFQTAKHHSKNLHITSQKAFTTKLSSLSSMGARPHSPGCAILTQIHY